MKLILNPDKNKNYDVWHFCAVCRRTWQGSETDIIKGHIHEDVRTVSTEKPFVILNE